MNANTYKVAPKMAHRTSDEEHRIGLKMTMALTSELIVLHGSGDTKAKTAVLDYLAFADNDSLVRLYDFIMGRESN